MTGNESIRKIKCPHCGWVRRMKLDAASGQGYGVLGVQEDLEKLVARLRELIRDPELEEANAWLSMPACPHCQRTYEYNVRTEAAR